MFNDVSWHVFLRTNTSEKAQKLLKKFEDACHTKITLLNSERYWKDNSLFDVSFSTPLNESVISEAVFKVLLTAHELAYEWQVTGPSSHKEHGWEFTGMTTKTKITGIEWIQFRLDSIPDHHKER